MEQDFNLLALDTIDSIIKMHSLDKKSDFNLLALDTVDTILKMGKVKDKKSFEYKFLHVHTLGNINMMYEVIHDN